MKVDHKGKPLTYWGGKKNETINNMKQSSIEWLIEQLGIEEIISDCKKEYRDRYIEKIQQAKEMHKQEIIKSRETAPNSITEYIGEAEDYYNWTYKNTYEKTR